MKESSDFLNSSSAMQIRYLETVQHIMNTGGNKTVFMSLKNKDKEWYLYYLEYYYFPCKSKTSNIAEKIKTPPPQVPIPQLRFFSPPEHHQPIIQICTGSDSYWTFRRTVCKDTWDHKRCKIAPKSTSFITQRIEENKELDGYVL